MPRQPKGVGNRGPNETIPKQYRLRLDTLADLEEIAAYLAEIGIPSTGAHAIRYAARQTVQTIRKKNKNLSDCG